MTVARTQHQLTLLPTVGHTDAFVGALAQVKSFAVTDSSDTTAEVYLGGLIPWRLVNNSGGSLTFTLTDAVEHNGTANTPKDLDNVSQTSYTIGDGESRELSSGLSGCTYLVITGSAAATGISLTCMR